MDAADPRAGVWRVNVLFATLLLGLQRLETGGVLPPTHYSMLEDMLSEGWTWGDTVSRVRARGRLAKRTFPPVAS